MKKQKSKKVGFIEKVKGSPINYFSDLFIVAMVVMWIVDNIYQSVIATLVTGTTIWLSIQTQMNCIDTSMWSSIGTNVAIPLGAGGAIWMIKNSVQHAIMNKKGKKCTPDFPAVNADGQYDGMEQEITFDSCDTDNTSTMETLTNDSRCDERDE